MHHNHKGRKYNMSAHCTKYIIYVVLKQNVMITTNVTEIINVFYYTKIIVYYDIESAVVKKLQTRDLFKYYPSPRPVPIRFTCILTQPVGRSKS